MAISLKELEKNNGQNGANSYIAYKGKVYDVSSVFEEGEHMGCEAGRDITDELDDVPHGNEILEQANYVGELE